MIIKVYRDGDSWGAFTGPDIQIGDCAFADTPEEAVAQLKREYPKYKNTDWVFCTGHDPKEQI